MTTEDVKIAVVGAGPAGTAAALAVQRAGASVALFERCERVGGRTRTDRLGDYTIDTNTQLFASTYQHVFRLLESVDAGHLRAPIEGRDALWRGGRAEEVVYGSVSSMLTSRAISARLKMRLGMRYLPFLAKHAGALDLHALERAAEAGLDEESISVWGERRIGSEFVNSLAQPQLASFFGVNADETSAALFHMLAQRGTHLSLYALQGGNDRLCGAMADALEQGGGSVRTSTPVRKVLRDEDAVGLVTDEASERFDGVIIATPAPVARALYADMPDAAVTWFGRVRTRDTVSIALLLDRPLGVRYFGLSFPRGEAAVLSAATVQENKPTGAVPAGKGMLVLYATPEQGERLVDEEPQAVLDALLPDLSGPFPGLEDRLERVRVYRWPHGATLFQPGYLHHLGRFREGGVEGDGPVVYAGDYLHAPCTEGAVTSGVRAAERLVTRLGDRGSGSALTH